MMANEKVGGGGGSSSAEEESSSIELGPAAALQMIGVEGKTHVAQACSDIDDHMMR